MEKDSKIPTKQLLKLWKMHFRWATASQPQSRILCPMKNWWKFRNIIGPIADCVPQSAIWQSPNVVVVRKFSDTYNKQNLFAFLTKYVSTVSYKKIRTQLFFKSRIQCIFFVFNFENFILYVELIVLKSSFIRIKKKNAEIFFFNKERDQGVRIFL